MDETGNRVPDKKTDASRAGRDWFAFGGYLIDREKEAQAKDLHQEFCEEWGVRRPFHVTDMLGQWKGFYWLKSKEQKFVDAFWSAYCQLLVDIEGIGLACVVDRPGYVDRGYLEKHGDDRWLLCRTAFDIAVERAAKYAISKGHKLRIVFESDPPFNPVVKGYFENLKKNGLEFDPKTSGKYNPLSKEDFAATLSTIEYKDKSSKLLQFADSYVYAIARHGYEKKFWMYRHLKDNSRIINFALDGDADAIKAMGVKYSCF